MADEMNPILSLCATTSANIKNLVIKDGQLIFIQDCHRIALDLDNKRTFYNQIVELNTDVERSSMDSPLPGYYFVIDTAVLWFYQDGWIQITGRPEEVLFIGVDLPELGQAKEGALYVNKAEKEIAIFDSETNGYIIVSDYTNEVTDEDIEKMFR